MSVVFVSGLSGWEWDRRGACGDGVRRADDGIPGWKSKGIQLRGGRRAMGVSRKVYGEKEMVFLARRGKSIPRRATPGCSW
jgi:hypothetical protein